jgi:hypothetical protein
MWYMGFHPLKISIFDASYSIFEFAFVAERVQTGQRSIGRLCLLQFVAPRFSAMKRENSRLFIRP